MLAGCSFHSRSTRAEPATTTAARISAPATNASTSSGTPQAGSSSEAASVDGDITDVITDGSALSGCHVDVLHLNAQNLTVTGCTITGGVSGDGSFTLTHNDITSQTDGIDPTGPGYKVIESNKIWRDGTRVGKRHEDGIQFWQGGNALISGNWISGWQTSAIMLKADYGVISNVTIDSNYLNNPTGYYQLYLCRSSYNLENITITHNAFGKSRFAVGTCDDKYTFVHTEQQRAAAIAAGNPAAIYWVVWNRNYIVGTGATVPPPGGSWAE